MGEEPRRKRSFIAAHFSGCKFLCTVQERSADWSIEVLLQKWGLGCSYEHPETFLRGTGISESDLTGNHTIFIINIFKK